MSESTLKLKAQADMQALDKWLAKIREAKQEVASFAAELRNVSGATGGNGGSGGVEAASGSPPPPPPTATGAHSSAPPAAPNAVPAGQFSVKSYRVNKKGEVTNILYGAAPPAPGGAMNIDDVDGQDWMSRSKGGLRQERDLNKSGSGFASGVGRFASNVASTAMGVALGGSVQGFLFQSAETYMRLSQVIAQLDARFGSASKSAAGFATSLGYTITQGGAFASAYGSNLNNFDAGRAKMMVGTARVTGQDAGQMVSLLSHLEQIRPSSVDQQTRYQRLIGGAHMSGMGRGRLPEYLQSVIGLQEQMLDVGLRPGDAIAQNYLSLPGMMFGATDVRAQGQRGLGVVQGLAGIGKSGPMQSFLTRALGFGNKDGPSFRETQVAVDKGLLDPGNLQVVLDRFDKMGIGHNADSIFKALHGVKGGMSSDALSRMSEVFADKDKRAEFFAGFGDDGRMKRDHAFAAGLSAADKKVFEEGGMIGLGGQKVSAGEAMAVRMEAMQLELGKSVAEMLDGAREIAHNLIKALKDIIGQDLGSLVKDGMGALVSLSANVRDLSQAFNTYSGGGLSGFAANTGQNAGVGWGIASQMGIGAGIQYGLANLGIDAAQQGERGRYMMALQAWAKGQGVFPGPPPGSSSVGGTTDGGGERP
jgi:hypothetical protein